MLPALHSDQGDQLQQHVHLPRAQGEPERRAGRRVRQLRVPRVFERGLRRECEDLRWAPAKDEVRCFFRPLGATQTCFHAWSRHVSLTTEVFRGAQRGDSLRGRNSMEADYLHATNRNIHRKREGGFTGSDALTLSPHVTA